MKRSSSRPFIDTLGNPIKMTNVTIDDAPVNVGSSSGCRHYYYQDCTFVRVIFKDNSNAAIPDIFNNCQFINCTFEGSAKSLMTIACEGFEV